MINGVQFRKLCRVLHRDLGYLFLGATVVYAASGIVLNLESDDWDPSYSISRVERPLPDAGTNQPFTRVHATNVLAQLGVTGRYRNHYFPADGQVRVFFDGGNATLDLGAGAVVVEALKRRPVLHTFNRLHENPGGLWTWYASIYGGALVVLAVTGMFMLRGRHSITRRGGMLAALGVLAMVLLAWFTL